MSSKDPFDNPFDKSHPSAMARTAIRLNPHLTQPEKDRVLGRLVAKENPNDGKDFTAHQFNSLPPELFDKVMREVAADATSNPELTQDQKAAMLRDLRNKYVGELGYDVLEAARGIGLEKEAVQWHADLVALHGDREGHKRKLKEVRGAIHRRMRDLERQHAESQRTKARIERSVVAVKEIQAWTAGPLPLQRPERSTYPKLREAFFTDEVYVTSAPDVSGPELLTFFDECWEEEGAQLFVIEHDWASAFSKAEGFDLGPFKLPHDYCIFEFRIGGRQIVVTCFMNETDGDVMMFHPVTRTSVGWFAHGSLCLMMADGRIGAWHGQNPITKAGDIREADGVALVDTGGIKQRPNAFVILDAKDRMFPVYRMITQQIRAVSIALEAEIAQTNVIRMPHKSNREPKGRQAPTGYSYHVVSLARRHRLAPVPVEYSGGEKRSSPRLHFRRPHVRHYQNHTTQISWTLVGNPDLGWVDKHYKL